MSNLCPEDEAYMGFSDWNEHGEWLTFHGKAYFYFDLKDRYIFTIFAIISIYHYTIMMLLGISIRQYFRRYLH